MAGQDMLKWVTIMSNSQEDGETGSLKMKIKPTGGGYDIPDIPDLDLPDGGGASKSKANKRLSVERIYQKKTQLEHILLRPDTYIGSVETVTQSMWVYDDLQDQMIQRELTYVPGLYKIFDEILVNAADNKQRDPKMNCIKIDIDPENNKIKIWNNGKGIPVVEHKTEKMFVPTMIFGHLLTSSNYDDSQKKVTGGRNGYGAKLCNIFSSKFTVETSCSEYKKAFKQSWGDNMGKATEPKIMPAKGEDYTCITFNPDLSKFKMTMLDKDIVDLFTRRAYDIAAASRGVKVFLNGKKLPVKNFKDYIDLYIKDKVDDNGQPLKVVFENANDRWEVAATLSEKGFQQVSFVNSIATTKGGRHVDYITDQVVTKLIDVVKKKEKKGHAVQIKPFQVKNHLWIFVNCLVENPTFDSQTKENMTLVAKNFGSKCPLTDKFTAQVSKCGIVESIQSWMKFKAQEKMNKKCGSTKQSKLKGIPKLDDANNAGTRFSLDCTLILTEGDSAKSLAVAGLGVVGRDRYGVFPLRGKVLNVREASHKQIMENAEINNLIKIMGLRYKEKYDSGESLKTLRYGKIMIMTDQDQDGSHIKGLLINFFHHNWPGLLQQNFLEEFITPIVKIHKNKDEKSFYSLPEFEEWKKETPNWHSWKIKYYKGLGTSTAKEAKEYFADMIRHRIPFKYGGADDDASIVLAFSKKKVDERKEWLTNWMEEKKRRNQLGLPELFLYGKDTRTISYNEFVNRELILFSNTDNERSIPSLVDGFKPGQRKVLFACFKRCLNKEVKVAQFAGAVSEISAYHHGEVSLMGTIVNMAQNFVGSNNINLLMPKGQFGTRLLGGKDAASPRYIHTQLSVLTRLLFHQDDEALLKHNQDDNKWIEPEWYIPIIPMVLVNGAEGIGTGWSTKVPNYDPRELTANLLRMLSGKEIKPMKPFYKNFKGTIEEVDPTRYVTNGEVAVIDDDTIEITELPIKAWTQTYKETVLEPMLHGTEKVPPLILDYKEYHTDSTVKFVIKMSTEKLARAEAEGLHKVFKLQNTIPTTSMVLFDDKGCIRKYNSPEEILQEFYEIRLDYYQRRKIYMEGMLRAEASKLSNMARFICEKCEKKISLEDVSKKDVIKMLINRNYDSDPVKDWKASQNKLGTQGEGDDEAEEAEDPDTSGPDFNYLLNVQMLWLTKEKKAELLKNRDKKDEELKILEKKTPTDLWIADIKAFEEELDKVEAQERLDDQIVLNKTVAKSNKTGGRPKFKKMAIEETRPSPIGRRVEPRIDASLKAKVTAAAATKRRKALKKEAGIDDDNLLDDDDDGIRTSLADRLGLAAQKPKGKPRIKKESGERKKSGGTPKKKKKNPWSDEEDDDISNSASGSDLEMNKSFEDIEPRVRAPRRQAVSKKYTFSDDEESFGSDEEFQENTAVTGNNNGVQSQDPLSGSDSDGATSPVKKPITNNKSTKRPLSSDDESDMFKSTQSTVSSKTTSQAYSPHKLDEAALDDIFGKSTKPKEPTVKPAVKKDVPKKGKKDDPNQPSIFKAFSKAKPKKPSMKDMINFDSDSEDDFPLPDHKSKSTYNGAALMIDSDSQESKGTAGASQASNHAAPKKTKKPASDLSDSSDGEFDPKPKKAPPKKAAPKKKKMDSDISDWSDGEFNPKPKKAPAKKAAPKKKKLDSDMSDLSDMSDGEFNPQPKKAPPKKKAAPKKKKIDSDGSDMSDMDFGKKPAKKRAKKGSDDDEFSPKKVKSTAARKKKQADSDDDDDAGINFNDIIPRERGGRSRQPIKYNFGESDDDDDEDDMF